MAFLPEHKLTGLFSGKVFRGAVIFLTAFIAAGLVSKAMALIYNPDMDRMSRLRTSLALSGQVRGSGLIPGSAVEVYIVENDGKVTSKKAEVAEDGTFMLDNAGLIGKLDSGPESVKIHININRDSAEAPRKVVFSYRKNDNDLRISGSGFKQGQELEIYLNKQGRKFNKRSFYADWSGDFTSGSVNQALPILQNSETCFRFAEGKSEKRLCLSTKLASKGHFSLLQFVDGSAPVSNICKGIPAASPFSTWEPPSNCKPAGTCLSVCDPVHIAAWQEALKLNYLRAFMAMTQQLSVLMVQQAQIIGAFIDAKHQLEVQRWFQKGQARTHSDYHPGRPICYYGTLAEEFSSLMRLHTYNTEALNAYMIDREIAPASPEPGKGAGAPEGPAQDKLTRLRQFKELYCDPDNNGRDGMEEICTRVDMDRRNKDINYSFVEYRPMHEINFEEEPKTDAETDIIALSKNLFSHEIFTRIPRKKIYHEISNKPLDGSRLMMDLRSVIALRGPMRDTFSNIIALHGYGKRGLRGGLISELINEYLSNMDINEYRRAQYADPAPSEIAMLSILMSKFSQNPRYIVELHETDDNVERMHAAQQAIENIGGRKAFESALRREMNLSARLEARLKKVQEELDAKIQKAIQTYDAPPAKKNN
jgi:hypothetical protein